MTEEEAWARATELNRELGQRNLGQRDPAYDNEVPQHFGQGFFVAQEVAEGDWQPVFRRDRETEGDRFFRRLFNGLKNLFSELLRP